MRVNARHAARELVRASLRCVAFIAILATPAGAQAGSVTVDLNAGTLNGRPIGDWTLSQVTEAFGRPGAVSPGIEGILGSQLHYHAQGLSFWFRPEAKDPAQHLWSLTMYVSRNWDSDHSAWYAVFSGTLAPPVDANWSETRLVKEFSSRSPVVETAKESQEKARASGQPESFVRAAQFDFVRFTTGGVAVRVAIEPITKFVEWIGLDAEAKK